MKVVVFYGTECDENTAWIPWLKKELEKENIECVVPKLPTPENQTYQNWAEIVSNIEIGKDDMVVGWSTGAIFAVRYLYENNLKVKKLVLVSGFNNYVGGVPFVDEINKDFFMEDLIVAQKVSEEIVCVKSDENPFITQEALYNFACDLNAKTINIKRGGHFNASAGYTSFSELLNMLK